MGALSLTGGGPIIASSSSTTFTSTAPATTTAAPTTVTPTTTVTMPYLGAVVAKGEATFVVGGMESKGVRGRGPGRGVLVGLGVGVVGMVGWWGGG